MFVLTEDGLGKLQVPHFPLATSYAEVAEALDALLDEDHAYSTVVVDSVDWLEPLIWAEACRRNGWQSIESPGFGKGYGLPGPAALSTKHTLAITNRGGAKAADVAALAREIRDGVRDTFGVALVNEPVFVGHGI